ncbi:hypothetical protein BC939DRAFT_167948 [Gamsiella multidivaricata]|uniref:uncharacterized protein n=1 Tax=Gamsiella multidivaricata TaxID=101098 RepID=UPI00221EE003|nr:uncharacterized protein BC939DRAFT_167948 [Gamsiella multidivaricata]KAI7823250.1 hypothetical protein BC939DRAFT_167948 [Gamsiella multidivaricata]
MHFHDMDAETPTSDKSPLERVAAIAELWANILAFMNPRMVHRLRLVSKRLYIACIPYFGITFPLNGRTLPDAASDPQFPTDLIAGLRLQTFDQVSPPLADVIQKCINVNSLEIFDCSLDVKFLEDVMRLSPRNLRHLIIHSQGFITLKSVVKVVLEFGAAAQMQSLDLDICTTGLDETLSLPWNTLQSILGACSSLTSLSLRNAKIMDVSEPLEGIDSLHAATARFPNILSVELDQCDISGVGRVRLLRMFPRLKALIMICRDTVFDVFNSDADGVLKSALDIDAGAADRELCRNLKHVSVRRTNSRSQADQHALYRFLGQLPRLESLELTGCSVSSQDLLEMAEEWTRRNVRLRHLCLDLNHRKVNEEGMERILRQGCCSRLIGLDTEFGPDLILRFWDQETCKSGLPFLETLQILRLRRQEDIEDLEEDALQVLNLTLRQIPRLVDLTIATRLNDFAVFQGLGRDPEVPLPAPGSASFHTNWLQERPLLQTLAIGCSSELFHSRLNQLPRQVGRRFRFLEGMHFVSR